MPDSLPLSTLRSSKPKSCSTSLLPPDHFHDPETSTPCSVSSSDLVHVSQDISRQLSPFADLPHPDQYKKGDHEDSEFERWDRDDLEEDDDLDADPEAMPSDLRRSSLRPVDSRAQAPLLSPGDKPNDYEQPQSPSLSRRRSSRFRERDPAQRAKDANRKRYTYAAGFLGLSLVTFAIQTETAVYIQHNLHWNKAYCML